MIGMCFDSSVYINFFLILYQFYRYLSHSHSIFTNVLHFSRQNSTVYFYSVIYIEYLENETVTENKTLSIRLKFFFIIVEDLFAIMNLVSMSVFLKQTLWVYFSIYQMLKFRRIASYRCS